jgi:hypothetical protein
MKMTKAKEFSDKIAYDYFVKKAKAFPKYSHLSPLEKMEQVRKIKRRVLFWSALYGALGVLLLYIPQYIFPEYFPLENYTIFFSLIKFRMSLNDLWYGIVLTAIEIWLLVLTDIRSVGRIAAVYGFPHHEATDTKEETERLIDISLGSDSKLYAEVGINPLQNYSKTGVWVLMAVFRIKAMLSKFVFRYILKKVLGRLSIRSVLDMVGVPIYAFWNAYASAVVMRKANMRMYAHSLMIDAGNWFYERYSDNEQFKQLLYDNLEFIALTKKSFYPTDYLFAKHFLTLFNITIVAEHKLSEDYFEKLNKLPSFLKRDIAKFMIIGFLTDGKLGSLEILGIKQLNEAGIIPYSIEQIKVWTKNYVKGYGFDDLLISE